MKDVAEFSLPSQEDVHIDLRTLLRGAVRVALEATLEEEMRLIVGAGRWARIGDRIDVRNGSYLRKVITGMGQVEVSVPRSREHGSAGDVLGRYQRRSDEIDNAMVAAYVNGISTRKMSSVTEALLDESVGRTTVSRVTRTLEQQVDALRKAPIPAAMPYLYLDATFINTRWARKVENVSVLVAYGVDTSGHRCLLAVTMGAQESQESWTDLLRQLVDRGLQGVELVIATILIQVGACHGPPKIAYARMVLIDSLPNPWDKSGHFVGMTKFTASELSRISWGSEFGHTTYVEPNVESADPEVVSVNPIDDFTWGAAAYSRRTGRCYVILTTDDPKNPKLGSTWYGRLAPDQKCLGSSATKASATSHRFLEE